MNWYIGQPIVAVRNSQCGKIKRGQEFTIKGIASPLCKCTSARIDVGIRTSPSHSWCVTCGARELYLSVVHWKCESIFAPLDQDISELTEILNQKQKV